MDVKPEWHCRIGRVVFRNGTLLRVLPPARMPNRDAIDMVEGLLSRLKAGDSVAVAFVDVKPGGYVATAWACGGHYHALNSGAAILAARLSR